MRTDVIICCCMSSSFCVCVCAHVRKIAQKGAKLQQSSQKCTQKCNAGMYGLIMRSSIVAKSKILRHFTKTCAAYRKKFKTRCVYVFPFILKLS
jgi:hypothetical protein